MGTICNLASRYLEMLARSLSGLAIVLTTALFPQPKVVGFRGTKLNGSANSVFFLTHPHEWQTLFPRNISVCLLLTSLLITPLVRFDSRRLLPVEFVIFDEEMEFELFLVHTLHKGHRTRIWNQNLYCEIHNFRVLKRSVDCPNDSVVGIAACRPCNY